MQNEERIIQILALLPMNEGAELFTLIKTEIDYAKQQTQMDIVRYREMVDEYNAKQKQEAQIRDTPTTTTIPIGFGGDIHC